MPPAIGALGVEMAMPASAAFFGALEQVPLEAAAGRIAAEAIAPAQPGVPRLVSGQRITAAHFASLTENYDPGAFFLDPAERTLRVVASRSTARRP